MSEGTPYVSLQRTFVILLIVYGVAAGFALLAGATLVAHVDPFSECILFSHLEGDKLYYGSEACKYFSHAMILSYMHIPHFQIVKPLDTCSLAALWGLWLCSTSPSSIGVS